MGFGFVFFPFIWRSSKQGLRLCIHYRVFVMGALTSLVLASTLVIFHQLVNVKTGCHCVQKTGGLGNGTSSELQLS